jgi:acetyl esterase/lipase
MPFPQQKSRRDVGFFYVHPRITWAARRNPNRTTMYALTMLVVTLLKSDASRTTIMRRNERSFFYYYPKQETGMKYFKLMACAAAVSALLAGCGGGDSVSDGPSFDTSGAPGSLVATPTTLTTLTPQAFQAAAPASLFQVAGTPKCTVTFNYFQYGTVGGAGEKTSASGGIMVPSGTDAACTGERPVLLYAHGTTTDKNKNMASPSDGETALIAAMFAAQGYIVVAPNYAGYDSSPLPYHPYLNMDQQAKDMVDALTAARKGFAAVGARANAKLFVSGYSQGGFVSMATQRALQLAGTPVTAAAHMSGPYALSAFGDAVYAGNVNLGATIFSPLLTTSLQRTYGNIYSTPGEMYEAAYAPTIETLLPSKTPQSELLATGKLPATAFFAADSLPKPAGFETFFGGGNLIKTSYRNAYLADLMANPTAPKHPLRVAADKNDPLKQNWTPNRPMLMCGGNSDPHRVLCVEHLGSASQFQWQRCAGPSGDRA